MKRIGNLFEKLINDDNLDLAITNSSKSKRKRKDVQRVLNNRTEYINIIREAICNGSFTKPIHKGTKIYDGSSRKERIIVVPQYICEQIVHHAVVQVLKSVLMRGMYTYSCGSVPKRGIHYGKRCIEKYIKEHKNTSNIKYCLKLDIKHFYQNIDINLLIKKFRHLIKDEKMLTVIQLILKANVAQYNGKLVNMGLPIGYYTSQWFANFFLQEFDHFVKEQLHVKCYVRYVDDVVIFSSNKRELHNIFYRITEFLQSENLKIKDNWQIFRFHYIRRNGKEIGRFLDFMGFKFYRNRTTIRKSILLRATRKARKINKKDVITWYDSVQFISYLGWFKHTNCFSYYNKYIKPNVNLSECKQLVRRHSKKIA